MARPSQKKINARRRWEQHRQQVARSAAYIPPLSGQIKKSRAVRLTDTQRDSQGNYSHWNRSALYFDSVERDARWTA